MASLDQVCDNLIDQDHVNQYHTELMLSVFESYKRATSLLGYFSRLPNYQAEYEILKNKVLAQRRDILDNHKNILITANEDIFKLLLIIPMRTIWYQQGAHKYDKVKNYSLYYYRRKIYIELENETIDLERMGKLIKTIDDLDRYYHIHEEVVGFFMRTSNRFDQMIRTHFSEYIHF